MHQSRFLGELRQAIKFTLEKCSTIIINVVQSGASIKDHYKKARNTTIKMTNSVAKKTTISYTSSFKKYFSVSNRYSFEIITTYV